MNKYTIYCTTEQTKKALELGAPIMTVKSIRTKNTILSDDVIEYDEDTFTYVVPPTAEQMIGWLLKEKGITIDITMVTQKIGYYSLRRVNNKGSIDFTGRSENDYYSLEEVIIAAIDTALEYLINNKK